MKKFLTLSMALLMVLALLAACGNNEPASTSTPTPTPASTGDTQQSEDPPQVFDEPPTVLSVMFHATWLTPMAEASFALVAEQLNIEWEWIIAPDGADGEQVIFTKINSGEAPDILWWQGARSIERTMGADKFEDVSGGWMQHYDADALKNNTYTLESGKVLAAPYGDANVNVWIYNKKVFADAGITTLPRTWSEFLDACEKIRAIGVDPVFFAGQDGWTLQLPTLNTYEVIGKFVPGAGDALAVNDKKWVEMDLLLETYERMIELQAKGFVNDNLMSADYAASQHAVINGTAAMFMMPCSWFDGELQSWATPEEMDGLSMMPVNFTEDPAKLSGLAWGPQGFSLPVDSPNKDLAREAIFALVSPASIQARYDVSPGIPFILESAGVNPGDAVGIVRGAYENIIAPGHMIVAAFPGPNYLYNYNYLVDNMQEMMMGRITPMQALEIADEHVRNQALEAGDPNWE